MSGPRHVNMRGRATLTPPPLYDRWLFFAIAGLVAMGLLMVASSSVVIAERNYGQPFYFLARQAVFLGVGLVAGLIVLRIEVRYWQKFSGLLLLLSSLLLAVILIPGIGTTVNGSTRWLYLGPLHMQPSELAKLAVVIYLAGYIVRHNEELRTRVRGFVKPMLLLGVLVVLLLKEPDFGATVVILTTALGMMFLAGVRLWQFAVILVLFGSAISILAISSPYRLERLTAFLNPWAYQFDIGYQLTQSLIAFGRGGWFGVGLGESVQKLYYLPEAHTDFLFAVLVEELGLVGALVVIALFVLLIGRALLIAKRALQNEQFFAGYAAYGIALWLGLQAMISIGVSSGVLPTKGLTLPLMSYGGSSMAVNCVVLALLMRIDHEVRWKMLR